MYDDVGRDLDGLVTEGEELAISEGEVGFRPNGEADRGVGGDSRAVLSTSDTIIWVAMEARDGVEAGDPIAFDAASFPVSGDRAVHTTKNGVSTAMADSTAWSLPATKHDDFRSLPVRWLPSGRHGRNFGESVKLLSCTKVDDWPVEGPRTTQWLCNALSTSDSGPLRRRYWRRQILGLEGSDTAVQEHILLSNIIECVVCSDQANISELAAFDHVSRRYVVGGIIQRSAQDLPRLPL